MEERQVVVLFIFDNKYFLRKCFSSNFFSFHELFKVVVIILVPMLKAVCWKINMRKENKSKIKRFTLTNLIIHEYVMFMT